MFFRRIVNILRACLPVLLMAMVSGAALLLSPRNTVAYAAPTRTHTKAIIDAPSPNYTPARNRHIDTVVLHFSSAITTDPDHWADAKQVQQIFLQNHVSAHYLIDRAGTVYRLVPEQDIAWHAGGSIMPPPDNRRNVNRFSIGIELIATRTSGYTAAQYTALSNVLQGIEARYPIRHIVGHDEISGDRAVHMGLRPDVKEDPGPLFDWSRVR